MKRWLHTIELFVDETIPFLLVALLFVTMIETVFNESHFVRLSADVYDGIVVLFFISDLAFKYHRTRNLPNFLKKYWIEIIASFPLFLVVRFLEFTGLAQRAAEGQQIARTIRQLRTTARSSRLLRFLTSVQDFKFYKRVRKFWEKPTGKHYRQEKNKRK